jgi:hypothetical protein
MLESLRRFRALEPAAQMLFLRAAVTLGLVSLSLRLRGFRPTQTMLQKSLSHPLPQIDPDSANRRVRLTARMVNAADRHGPVHPSCLAKSLTLWWLLGRQGIASQLRIGIRKENDRLEAHAWVEREDIALNEPEERHRHYAAFDAGLASSPEEER